MRKFPTPHGHLSSKQIKFVRNVVATNFDPDKIEAAVVLAGYNPETAKATGSRLLSHAVVRANLLASMEKSGITIETLTDTHAEALEAVKMEGKFEVPDHNVRLKAVRMGLELLDAFPSKKVEVAGRMEHEYRLNVKALRKAEEITGEEIIDVEALEKSELERPF
jgi:hypothetical protein